MTLAIVITDDLATCMALRMEVFVEEQKVPAEEEADAFDDVATHLLARDEAGRPVGTARILEQGQFGKIGRVCVAKSHRGTGLGRRLIAACLDEISSRPHLMHAKLGSQNHAIGFYERLGFTVVGDEYLDAGIPHHDMICAV